MGIGAAFAKQAEIKRAGGLESYEEAKRRERRDQQYGEQQYEYETYYEPQLKEYAAGGLEASGNVLEREMAKLRMRLGYNQSAGAGTGGWWNLAKSGMETAGMQKGQQLASDWSQWQAGQHLGYLGREDQQAHQLKLQDLQYRQQLELMRQQAELNDPTWWNSFGSVVGIGAALLGFAFGGPAGGAAGGAAGGIVGGGVGGASGMIF